MLNLYLSYDILQLNKCNVFFQQKFFDSGDYQMAKQAGPGNKFANRPVQQVLGFGTGDTIPTPETVPARKTSIIQPKFNSCSSTPSSNT